MLYPTSLRYKMGQTSKDGYCRDSLTSVLMCKTNNKKGVTNRLSLLLMLFTHSYCLFLKNDNLTFFSLFQSTSLRTRIFILGCPQSTSLMTKLYLFQCAESTSLKTSTCFTGSARMTRGWGPSPTSSRRRSVRRNSRIPLSRWHRSRRTP